MTFDTDFVRLHLAVGVQTLPCKALNLEWPPPKRLIELKGVELGAALIRRSMSQLSDEIAAHPNVARGAEYFYEEET